MTNGLTYTFGVCARNSAGRSNLSDLVTVTLVVGTPTAALDNPAAALKNDLVDFDASGSNEIGGTIVSYSFDFGDSTPILFQNSSKCTHAYSSCGTYTVNLSVKDGLGKSASTNGMITIGTVLSPQINLSNNAQGRSSDVQALYFDHQGTANLFWTRSGSGYLLSRSFNGGSSFGAPTTVLNLNTPEYHGIEVRDESVASTSKCIFAAWSIVLFIGQTEVGFCRSADGGANFSEEEPLSKVDGIPSYHPLLAANQAGTVCAPWS